MAKIYLAGKVDSGEQTINTFADELEERGHDITLKWWELPQLSKPYLDNQDESQIAADNMEWAVRQATEALILFPTDTILGAAVEYGVAIGDRLQNPQREIIVVNPFEVRQSVFYASSAVIAVHGLTEIRQRAWY